jgi:hypothetical protein
LDERSLLESKFPPGTPVCVRESFAHRQGPIETETVGAVVAWEDRPTGSWYAHGRKDKLWLRRLILRKFDGELTRLVIDEHTSIARLEAVPDGAPAS